MPLIILLENTLYLVIIEDDESKERHEDKDLDEDEEVVLVGHAPDDAPLLLAHPDHNNSLFTCSQC